MIRNQSNYLTLSVQDTKGKEGRTYSNGTTIITLQAESQKVSLSQNLAERLSKIKKSPGQTCEDIQWQK